TRPGTAGPSGPRQGDAALALILATPILVRHLALLVGFEEQHLCHTLVGVDLGRQRGGVGELQGHMAFPLGFQRGDVDNDTAAGVGALAQADGQHIARDAEVFHRARQGEGIRRNDADVALDVDEALLVEVLGIHGGRVDVDEHLDLVSTAHIVAVAGYPVGNYPLVLAAPYLALDKGFDHAVILRHLTYPAVRFDSHG